MSIPCLQKKVTWAIGSSPLCSQYTSRLICPDRPLKEFVDPPRPTQVWPICPFVWKSWKHARLICSSPSKIYILWCRLWFYDCLSFSTEIKDFPTFCSRTHGNAIFSGINSKVKFQWFLTFLLVYFSDIYIFTRDLVAALENIV